MFTVGKKVEVSFESESLRDCWVPATILTNSDNNSFLVEYQQPGAGDEPILNKVTVDYLHIRPSPPHLWDKNFVLLDKVDAYYDFGWWSGVITEELADNRYNVTFKNTKKEIEFIYSKVRPHMEWKGGKWFNASQGDLDGRTTNSLIDEQIEQTTPSTDKQPIVATSLTRRTNQKRLVSNDKGSPSSKKPRNKITINDTSKKTNHPSVGQPDSDQASGKIENLSHRRKVRSKLALVSSRKRGRPVKGSKVDPVKTKAQEVVGNNEITEDSPIRIVVGLQRNGMTVSQGKLSVVTKTDTQQAIVPFAPLKLTEKKGCEGDAASVTPKRKRGRPPKLQASNSKTSITLNSQNGGVVPSVAEGDQKKVGLTLTTSLVTKSLEGNQGPNNTGKDLDVQSGQGGKKYSAKKGKRGKPRTISINTESPAQDSQDTSKEKTDLRMEKESEPRNLEASVGKSLDTVSDDRPISRWIEAKHTPITVHGPEEATVEQSSKASERRDLGSEYLPFVRNASLWKTIESMDAFRMLPQKPHFRPLLEGVIKESAREGLAIGAMVTFSTVVDKTCDLRFDDPRSTIEDCLETLVELENSGFDIGVVRERLTRLLLMKDKQEELAQLSKGVAEKMEERTGQGKTQYDEEIKALDRQIKELEEKRKQVVLTWEKWNSETGALEEMTQKIKQDMMGVGAEFDLLAAAPL